MTCKEEFLKGVRLLIVLCLALAYSGRELPELFTLGDDVSNDGVVVASVCKVAHAAPDVRTDDAGRKCSPPRQPEGFSLAPEPLLRTQAGQDLLVLLSLQRK